MSIQAYPLTWPEGFPRAARKMSDQFKTSLAGALGNVEKSLKAWLAGRTNSVDGAA